MSDKALSVFILPPDFSEWMRRMDGRGAMHQDEKRRRLISAAKEIELALQRPYFKFISNFELGVTVDLLHDHIISGNFEESEQEKEHEHARKLLKELKKYISTFA